MKTIEEFAQEYAHSDEVNLTEYNEGNIETVEYAYKAGAKQMREELAQWYDPKEYLPKLHDDVLVKYYLNGKYAYAVANLNESMPEGYFWLISPIDIVLRHSSVVGWRPIHE